MHIFQKAMCLGMSWTSKLSKDLMSAYFGSFDFLGLSPLGYGSFAFLFGFRSYPQMKSNWIPKHSTFHPNRTVSACKVLDLGPSIGFYY